MPTRRELANAIRALSMDAVQRARSGHPGMPMGMADIAEVLWNDFLRHDPQDPAWPDRDRFVLSNGHGSMLIYSLLHLSGYALSLDDLRDFRQLHAKTAGHPEYGLTPGVETTTGPLGQGLANAVGMAIAERALAARFNKPGFDIVDHHTWVFAGDGCLMEGISHEACSLAGTLGLGKLICIYDDNGISIDGEVQGWFTDDTPARFEAYGWQVIRDVDGHDPQAITSALQAARDEASRPSLICCKTVIGWGSPNKAGTADSHGAPLGEDEIVLARERIGWRFPAFEIPTDIRAAWDARKPGAARTRGWQDLFEKYTQAFPELAAEFSRRVGGTLPDEFAARADELLRSAAGQKNMATRKASQFALEGFGPGLPELIGGSADLTGSNNTRWSGSSTLSADNSAGNYLYFGVREFAMAAIGNGLVLHGGCLPYVGTFLVFTDYARNALRMAALMGLRNIFVMTHDSVGLGEDGPTHQPIEHVESLRLIPNMHVWRPCDVVETVAAWQAALQRANGPAVLALTRQTLPQQTRADDQIAAIARGGYTLWQSGDGNPEAIIIATGSEVELAVAAAKSLGNEGRRVRVVSMPCREVFDAQGREYRETVLPPAVRCRLALEAGVSSGWHRYVGDEGRVIGIDRFGESAPAGEIFKFLGFTEENVAGTLRAML
ncbi:MAG: transketolase [Gammaproteobacteria bacterium]|nr:transketolase [Gammaproteobacteria bacterium]